MGDADDVFEMDLLAEAEVSKLQKQVRLFIVTIILVLTMCFQNFSTVKLRMNTPRSWIIRNVFNENMIKSRAFWKGNGIS